MKSYLNCFLVAVAMAMCFVGCDVHEFPEIETPDRPIPEKPMVELQITLNGLDWEELTTVEWNPDPTAAASRAGSRASVHKMRFNLNVYDDYTNSRVPSRNLRSAQSWTIDAPTSLADVCQRLELNLPAGEYIAVAWIDYVNADAPQADLYYDTTDFAAITLLGADHPGNSHYREAFRGATRFEINMLGHVIEPESRAIYEVVPVVAERPMARYEIVTTDLDEFIKNNIAPRTESDPAGAPSAALTPDLDNYIVRVRYASYMPTTYNCHTDRPVDAKTGVSYQGQIQKKSDHEAILGFDHVFVNGTQTSVQLAIEVYSRSTGHLLASTDPIAVPLQRNRHTYIKGKFLTTKATGGAGINPDFDGEFNIEIK